MRASKIFFITTGLILSLFFSITYFPVHAETTPPDPQKVYLPAIFRDYDPSWQWNSFQLVTLTPTPLGKPYTTIDSSGRLHIFWNPWSGPGKFIYHVYQTDTGWTLPTPIANTLGGSEVIASPVAGPDGSIHIIWKNDLNFGGPYRLMYARWKDGVWEPEMELHRTTLNGITGSIELDALNRPHVIIDSIDNYSHTTFYHCIPQGSGCSEKTKLPYRQMLQHMILDAQGGILIFESSLYSGELYYSYWFNGAFQLDRVWIGGDLNYRQTTIDSNRNTILPRLDSVPIPGGNVQGIYTQCFTSNRVWTTETVLTGEKYVSSYLFSHSTSHQIASAWQENTTKQLFINRWQDCSPVSTKSTPAPKVGTKTWGNLVALSVSDQPKKACMLGSVSYHSNEFISLCADFTN